jgi:hypothetical protein
MHKAKFEFLNRRSEVRVLSGPPANKINDIADFLATVATGVGDSFDRRILNRIYP